MKSLLNCYSITLCSSDLLPHAGSLISCPESLDVEETDGIITITCNRSSALPFKSVANVTSEDGTALGKLLLLTLGAHAQRGLQ